MVEGKGLHSEGECNMSRVQIKYEILKYKGNIKKESITKIANVNKYQS